MKQVLFSALLILCVLLQTACSKDEESMSSNNTSPFVGFWVIPNINASGGISYYMLLYSEGKMKGGSTNVASSNKPLEWGSLYNWNYNDETEILATTASYGSVKAVNLQWKVTLKTTESWTGLALYESKNSTCVANRDEGYMALSAILSTRKWVKENENSGTGTLTFSNFFQTTPQNGNIHVNQFGISSTYKDELFYYFGKSNFYITGNFDMSKEVFTGNYKYLSLTIEHPYSYSGVRVHLKYENPTNEKQNFDYWCIPKD